MMLIRDMSATRQRTILSGIALLLRAVYNRLKEKSKKNRLVDNLSTNKKKFSITKVLKFLRNNPDQAQRIYAEQFDAEDRELSRERAAQNIISNINEYENIFLVPFPPTIERPREEIKEQVPQPATSTSQQFENVDESIQATSFLPPRNPEQQQIASSQQDSLLSTASDEELITQLNITLDRLVELENITDPSPEQQQERQQVLGVTERLIESFPRITGRTLSSNLLQMPAARQRFDDINRNVTSPVEALPNVNRTESNLQGEQREQPKPNASGDVIQDIQHEAENAGSDEVQRAENIDQGSGRIMNLQRINNLIGQMTMSQRTVNQLVNSVPRDLREPVRNILKGNVRPDDILNAVVSLGMISRGVSPQARNLVTAIINTAQKNGLSLDKYLIKKDDGYNPTVAAVRELPAIARSFVEDYNAQVSLSLDALRQQDESFADVRDEDYELTVNELQSVLTDDISSENDLHELPLGFNNFMNEMAGAQVMYGEEGFTRDNIRTYLEGRKNIMKELQEKRKTMTTEELRKEASNVIRQRKKIEERKEEIKQTREENAQPVSRVQGTVGAAFGLAGGLASSLLSGVPMQEAVVPAIGGALAGAAANQLLERQGVTGPIAAGVAGAAGIAAAGAATLGGGIANVAAGLMREPVKVPPDTLKVVQQDDKGTGKLRPKFIIPSTDLLQPTNQQIQADMDEWNMFDFVNPTSEGANGTAANNPLKLQGIQENEIRYRDAGMDVTQMFWDDLPYTNEQLVEYTIGAPVPALPEMKFQENEEQFFDDRGQPQLSLWGRHGGYNASSQANAIEIQSPFRNFTEVTQLDEDINNSILYGKIPMLFPESGKF